VFKSPLFKEIARLLVRNSHLTFSKQLKTSDLVSFALILAVLNRKVKHNLTCKA